MPEGNMVIEERTSKEPFKRMKKGYTFRKYRSLVMKCKMISRDDRCNKAGEPVGRATGSGESCRRSPTTSELNNQLYMS